MEYCASEPSPSKVPLAPWVGVVLGILASVGMDVGNNVQALGLEEKARIEEETGLPGPNPQTWVLGTIIFVAGVFVKFVAFMFAPASILAPLESVQFISNLLFARVVRGRPITLRPAFATFMIVAGTTLAVVFGPTEVTKFTQMDLMRFWINPAWIFYVVLASAAAVGFQLLHIHYQKALDNGISLPHDTIILPVTFAGSSVMVGTQCMVQSKCMSELLELLVSGTNVFSCWFTYFVIIMFASATVIWLRRLNSALAKYDALFIIPLLQSGYIVVSAIAGGIYFQEFSSLDQGQWICFAGGICVMLVGLAILMNNTAGGVDEHTGADSLETGECLDAPESMLAQQLSLALELRRLRSSSGTPKSSVPMRRTSSTASTASSMCENCSPMVKIHGRRESLIRARSCGFSGVACMPTTPSNASRSSGRSIGRDGTIDLAQAMVMVSSLESEGEAGPLCLDDVKVDRLADNSEEKRKSNGTPETSLEPLHLQPAVVVGASGGGCDAGRCSGDGTAANLEEATAARTTTSRATATIATKKKVKRALTAWRKEHARRLARRSSRKTSCRSLEQKAVCLIGAACCCVPTTEALAVADAAGRPSLPSGPETAAATTMELASLSTEGERLHGPLHEFFSFQNVNLVEALPGPNAPCVLRRAVVESGSGREGAYRI